MFCKQCGNQVSDSAKFCNKCGAQIERKVKTGGVKLPTNINKRNVMIALAVVCAVFVVGFIGVGLKGENNEMGSLENTQTDQDLYNTEEESVSLTSAFADAKQGNILTFGTYEQDNNLNNGKEPIEWIVLRNENNKLLVVSKYVIDLQQYHSSDDEPITWEQSEVREWLNSEFIDNAFTEEEKGYIVLSHISTPNTNGVADGRYDQLWETYGGNDTEDYIFLLTEEEIEKDLLSNKVTQATEYVVSCAKLIQEEHDKRWPSQFAYYYKTSLPTETNDMTWWTRSSGTPMKWEEDYSVKTTGYTNNVILFRYSHYHDGIKCDCYEGIRPAMWIEIRE